MIYSKQRKHSRLPGGYFHLQEEKTKTRVAGYGHGDHIKLKDEYGNIWRGSALRNPDNSVAYRFRDNEGHTYSGVADGILLTLRDDKGSTWKGVVD